MFVLHVAMTSSVLAESDVVQALPGALAQGYGQSSNPWSLPQKQDAQKNSQQDGDSDSSSSPNYYNQRYDNEPANNKLQQGRFVTPEILESLKQQQTRTQMSPVGERLRQARPGQQRWQGQQQYSSPSYGMNYAPPVFGTPSVSPWGNSPNILYQGQSLPMVPNEAIGGIPPMGMPLFEEGNLGEGFSPNYQNDNNVFNPFTFIPNNDLH